MPIVVARPQVSDTPLDAGGLAYVASSNAALGMDEVKDDFWTPVDFKIDRWDKMYPYQLIVVDVKKDNSGNTSYSIHKNAIFTLPVPPESLTITTPFAMTATVTLGGIIEESNGTPIKTLQFSGSFGYLPLRGTFPYNSNFSEVNNVTGGLIQGTVSEIAGISSKISSIAAKTPYGVHSDDDFQADAPISKTTGYYQANKLKDFLSQYAAIKKTVKGKSIRLAVAIWKDNTVYLVTPQSYVVAKDVSSPMELRYSLSFEAWKTIDLSVTTDLFTSPPPVRTDSTALSKVINTLSVARDLVREIGNVPQAILGDITHINEAFRQSIGFCKDVAGTIQSYADLPESVKTSIVQKAAQDGHDFKVAGKQIANASGNWAMSQTSPAYAMIATTQKKAYKDKIEARFGNAPVDQFNSVLSQKDKEKIKADIIKNRQLTRNDFEAMRDALVAFSNKMSYLLGAGNSTFSFTYGLGTIVPIKDEPSDSDWDLLYALNDSVIALDALAATGSGEPSEPARLMDSMATLARASGIAFQVPVSKFAVPFPYQGTLEGLATRYLGDPNRSLEIATLNGLREPYVDETGFELPLLVAGFGNNVLVPFSENLYVGQKVTIRSSSVTKTVRRITDIKRDLNNNLTITLDALGDLSKYKVADAAVFHTFLPDTINSQNLIYIPSDQEPIENDYLTKEIPTVDTLDPMVMASGVDLLLDSNKDLILTPDGDSRLASGLPNIVQHVEIALGVKQGSLLLHRGFGLPLAVGDSTADVDVNKVVESVKKMFSNDPTFSRVGKISVVKNGPSVAINASAAVSGSQSYLPLTFALK
jgi:hypothetical protein